MFLTTGLILIIFICKFQLISLCVYSRSVAFHESLNSGEHRFYTYTLPFCRTLPTVPKEIGVLWDMLLYYSKFRDNNMLGPNQDLIKQMKFKGEKSPFNNKIESFTLTQCLSDPSLIQDNRK